MKNEGEKVMLSINPISFKAGDKPKKQAPKIPKSDLSIGCNSAHAGISEKIDPETKKPTKTCLVGRIGQVKFEFETLHNGCTSLLLKGKEKGKDSVISIDDNGSIVSIKGYDSKGQNIDYVA